MLDTIQPFVQKMSGYVGTFIARAGGSTAPASQYSGGATAVGGAFVPGGAGEVDPNELVSLWIDYILLIIFAFFTLAALPRFFAHATRLSDWASGYFLRKGSNVDAHTRVTPRLPASYLHRYATNVTLVNNSVGNSGSDQSHTLAQHDVYADNSQGKSVRLLTETSANAPVHVRSYASLLHPVATFFTRNVAPGMSVGGALLNVAYIAGLFTAVFTYGGDPLKQPVREGWIAISLIPVVVALGTKNNLIGMMVGKGYERVKKNHSTSSATVIFICSSS